MPLHTDQHPGGSPPVLSGEGVGHHHALASGDRATLLPSPYHSGLGPVGGLQSPMFESDLSL
eukprot:10699844-Heterocapsa_arctica.AAC.1